MPKPVTMGPGPTRVGDSRKGRVGGGGIWQSDWAQGDLDATRQGKSQHGLMSGRQMRKQATNGGLRWPSFVSVREWENAVRQHVVDQCGGW